MTATVSTIARNSPELPDRARLDGGEQWSDETREWWEAIWRSDAAAMWIDIDAYELVILALLREAFFAGRLELADEIRRWSDAFGLTPGGRAELERGEPND